MAELAERGARQGDGPPPRRGRARPRGYAHPADQPLRPRLGRARGVAQALRPRLPSGVRAIVRAWWLELVPLEPRDAAGAARARRRDARGLRQPSVLPHRLRRGPAADVRGVPQGSLRRARLQAHHGNRPVHQVARRPGDDVARHADRQGRPALEGVRRHGLEGDGDAGRHAPARRDRLRLAVFLRRHERDARGLADDRLLQGEGL